MEEFDIEKIEGLDDEYLSNQLKYIFKSEEDIVNFINFLHNIQNFVALSENKKFDVLLNITFFKSQIQLFEKQVKSTLDRKKFTVTKNAVKKAKMCGEKLSENTITYYIEEDKSIETLEKIYNTVSAWTQYLTDLYFMTSQTNKKSI